MENCLIENDNNLEVSIVEDRDEDEIFITNVVDINPSTNEINIINTDYNDYQSTVICYVAGFVQKKNCTKIELP